MSTRSKDTTLDTSNARIASEATDRAGIRTVRACGKHLGRPRRIVNHEELGRLRDSGVSIEAIARKLGVGYGTVRLRLGLSS